MNLDGPLRILLLEDGTEAGLGQVERVTATLARQGMAAHVRQVVQPADFEAALAGPLDLVLADHPVAGLHATDILALVRRHHPGLPVIFLADPIPAIGERNLLGLLTPGATATVRKSGLDQLGDAVRRALAATTGPPPDRDDLEPGRPQEDTLRESRQRLRLACELGAVAPFDWHPADDTLVCGAGFATIHGWPADGPDPCRVGRTAWLESVHPDDRHPLAQRLAQAAQTGRFEAEWRAIGPDGTVRWLAGRAELPPGESLAGPARRLPGVAMDITARKAVENAGAAQPASPPPSQPAQRDALTGLMNRALLRESTANLLPVMRRSGYMVACLFIGLDDFQAINDAHGRDVGDQVLAEVARRLTGCVREADLVGRHGGDEFVAVLAHVHGEADAAQVAEHIVAQIGEPCPAPEGAPDTPLQVTASIGISLYPKDADTVDDLVRCAEQAMEHARHGGRNPFSFHRPAQAPPVRR